ncbi:hypothetical protein PC118_g14860 [Phytophthora cactorum]|uniref:Calmodulin n=1 Tax=Phytophthora cactorum TaxID=29920 RepID=A0A8T1FSG5_9STRA|nr:hypothetical protein PC118_g14860 [Phytophthora cactorum]
MKAIPSNLRRSTPLVRARPDTSSNRPRYFMAVPEQHPPQQQADAAVTPGASTFVNNHSQTSASRKPLGLNYGSIRRSWRGYMDKLAPFPKLQQVALEAASFFTKPDELEFNLPRNFHAKYALGDKLGEGAFGAVYCALPMQQEARGGDLQLDLAVKIVPKSRVVSRKDYAALKQEGRMMVLLGGTLNVVHFFGAYEDDTNVYLVMERCVGGDASERLSGEKDLDLTANPKQEERAKIGRFPFESGPLLDERIQHEEIDLASSPWTGISDEAKALVNQLLERDVSKRLTAEQALKHPWLDPSAPLSLEALTTASAAAKEATKGISGPALNDVLVLFSEVSRDGSESVGLEEFAAYVAAGGYRLTRGEAKGFLRNLDLDGNGLLSRDEFCAALLDWPQLQSQHHDEFTECVNQVFDVVDEDKDGLLTLEDVAELTPFQESGKHLHSFRNDLDRCFQYTDRSGRGSIDKEDFKHMLRIPAGAYAHFPRRLRL